MSAQHTPGRLHVAGQDKVQIRSEKHQIAKAWSFAGKTGQENARRLAACWNACEGLPTDLLENLTLTGDTITARLIAAAPELLAALAGMLAIVDDSQAVAGYHLNGELEPWDGFPEIERARAAIAKATGEQA